MDPKFKGWNASEFHFGAGLWEKDFNLKDDSPAKNAGDDGTDLGIFGGQFPWPKYEDGTDNKGEPNIPVIHDLNILNRVIGENGKIKFKIKGESVK